jgi:hypothetical protein
MRTIVVTPPAAAPVSLAQAKVHLRVSIDEDDALISAAIAAVVTSVETATRRALMPQTLETAWGRFPGGRFAGGQHWGEWPLHDAHDEHPLVLPRAPVRSVLAVAYTDPSGADVTLDPAAYRVVAGGDGPGELVPAIGTCWPATACYPDAVRVRYEAGYEDADAVPACAVAVILLRVGTLYENREQLVTGTIVAELSDTERWLLAPLDWGGYP